MTLKADMEKEWREGPCRCANNLVRWSIFEGGWSNRLSKGWRLSSLSGLYFKNGAARYGARRPRKFKVSQRLTPLPL